MADTIKKPVTGRYWGGEYKKKKHTIRSIKIMYDDGIRNMDHKDTL